MILVGFCEYVLYVTDGGFGLSSVLSVLLNVLMRYQLDLELLLYWLVPNFATGGMYISTEGAFDFSYRGLLTSFIFVSARSLPRFIILPCWNRGYFMVGECGRFFFTSCERRERTSERSERVSPATPRNEWRKIGQTNQPWSNLFILYVLRFQKNTTQKNRYEE